MTQLDTYRNTLARKKNELVKLNQDLAREQAKISPQQKKIISANSSIGRTKSQSTIKSKLNEIERANKAIADTQKKSETIQKKIAQKEKEIAAADKSYRAEEIKVNKKQSEEAFRQAKAIEQSVRRQEINQSKLRSELEQLKQPPKTITVLFMAANPQNTGQLRLDEEARSIQKNIRLSDYRDSVKFETRWATRSSDVLQAINETNPTVVHFSGHGTQSGELVLLNPDGSERLVTREAISMAMSTASDSIRLVVFNTCFSESQAVSIVDSIEAAIGMSDSINDAAACVFAARLYSSIGFGKSLRVSFDQAKAQLLLDGIPGEDIPKIYAREDINLENVFLVQP